MIEREGQMATADIPADASVSFVARRPGAGCGPTGWDARQDCPICGALQSKEREEPMCEECHSESVNNYWRNRMAWLREKHK